MKNWRTNLVGLISLLVAIYHCYEAGKFDVMCAWSAIVSAGFFVAKDANVTGGTVAQTPEALKRTGGA